MIHVVKSVLDPISFREPGAAERVARLERQRSGTLMTSAWTLTEVLHVQQPAIAKIERRSDMYLSTLRRHIEAMGGELEVVARFPDGSVKISNFSELEKPVAA